VSAHEQVQQMLSAFLDEELTQAESQRVRIHLEDCEECRRRFAQLESLRRATTDLEFAAPLEAKMDELHERISVQAPRRAGWGFLLVGLLGWLVYALYLFVIDPPAATPANLIAGAFVIGLACLLVSVARQRWLELPHDRYRGVKK